MPCNKQTIPTPCQQLQAAQAQMVALLSGQTVTAVETPQLGRVEYNTKADVGGLQRLIDYLTAQCALAQGDYLTYCRSRRRPLSLEAWP